MSGERTPLLDSTPSAAANLSQFQYIMVMFSLYFGVYLAALDGTVVSTLLSHIASDLNELSNISWVATSYLVSYSAFQPLYGKISDIFGRKTVLIFCNSMFAIGCAICGTSHTLGVLVLGRFVSGVGAGGLLSLSTIAISDYVPLRKRGIYQGINNVAFGIGAATGGVFGGLATTVGGWRLAFSAQVPLCIVGIVCIYKFLEDKKVPADAMVETDVNVLDEEMRIQSLQNRRRKSAARRPSVPIARNSLQRIDFVGSITLVASLLLFMLAVNTGGNQLPWSSPYIILCFVLSTVVLGVFVYWELYRAVEPILPIKILLHRTIISACLTNFFAAGTNYSFLFYSPLYLTAAYDFNYNKVARRLIANFIGVALGSLLAGVYMARTGKYYGLGILATTVLLLGTGMFAIMPWLSDEIASSVLYTSAAYLISGMGYTATLTTCLTALIAAVPSKFQAMTTSAQYTFRGTGSSIGTALSASTFENMLHLQLVKNVKGSHADKIIEKVSHSVEQIRKVPAKYLKDVLWSYKMAGASVFGLCIIMMVFGTISNAAQQVHDITHDEDQVMEDIQDYVIAH